MFSQGKFSSKSDVWSFGVTLWEMFTFAREQPYCDLSDEQVLDNCSTCYHSNRLACILPRPARCTREIFDFLLQCWSCESHRRPSFVEICMFLAHKNAGYDPSQEQVEDALCEDCSFTDVDADDDASSQSDSNNESCQLRSSSGQGDAELGQSARRGLIV